mgnify:CR=1 FL=1
MRGSHGGFGDIDAEGMASTMIMRKTMDTRGSTSRKKIRRNGVTGVRVPWPMDQRRTRCLLDQVRSNDQPATDAELRPDSIIYLSFLSTPLSFTYMFITLLGLWESMVQTRQGAMAKLRWTPSSFKGEDFNEKCPAMT